MNGEKRVEKKSYVWKSVHEEGPRVWNPTTCSLEATDAFADTGDGV